MKYILVFIIMTLSGAAMGNNISNSSDTQNAYSFSFDDISTTDKIKLSDYQGKVIMVVNTASLCGFTKQYSELEELYKQYKDTGFVIIAVPSNDFGKQEPSSNSEIKKFCETNFNITFPIASKVHVQTNESHPFFIWTRENLGFLSGPKWNFYKYLIGRDGKLITYFSSFTKPTSKKLVKALQEALKNGQEEH